MGFITKTIELIIIVIKAIFTKTIIVIIKTIASKLVYEKIIPNVSPKTIHILNYSLIIISFALNSGYRIVCRLILNQFFIVIILS